MQVAWWALMRRLLSVCLGLLRVHYTPLQRYMGYLCTRKAQYAPPRRNMHHGAQGRLYFLKNSGDPDDFFFVGYRRYVGYSACLSVCLSVCLSSWVELPTLRKKNVTEWAWYYCCDR